MSCSLLSFVAVAECLLAEVQRSSGQISPAPQCDAIYSMSFNSLHQSPCLVAAYLCGACNGGNFLDWPLLVDSGPGVSSANPCQCSSVVCSLAAACADCRNRSHINWSAWNTNCSALYLPMFPAAIDPENSISSRPYLDFGVPNIYNPTCARKEIDEPDPIAGVKKLASGGTNAGGIVGGIAGSILGLYILVGLCIPNTLSRRYTDVRIWIAHMKEVRVRRTGSQMASFAGNDRSVLGRGIAEISGPNLVGGSGGQAITRNLRRRPLPPFPTEDTAQHDQNDISEANTRGPFDSDVPKKVDRPSFSCSICLERHPQEDVASIDKCGHLFCRESIRSYIGSKLGERRFPIVCPSCHIARGSQNEPGMVTEILALQVGISEEQYTIWNELELVDFSVLVYCRRCQRTAAIDRQDHHEAVTLACPLPGCNYRWCKSCQQEVVAGGPRHSCDGSLELDNLIREEGWRRCPGMCNTPIQRSSGCNHMTCKAPGCNSHFCYRCGALIVKSTVTQEINTAVNGHYRAGGQCTMF